MAVNFRFVKSNGEASPNFIHGCFGTLMSKCRIFYTNLDRSVSEYDIRKYNYLEYFQYSDPFQNLIVKTIQEDTAFKLKIFRQITNQFPWMKEVIKVRYSDGNTLLNNKGAKASRYTLVAKLDLSKPADTVWFCLNLFRLITRNSIQNGTLNSYPKSVFKELYELTEGDAWKTVLLSYGFHCGFVSNAFSNKARIKMSRNSFSNTCLTPLNEIEKEQSELFIKDPVNFLNRTAPVLDINRDVGLITNSKTSYFTGQYFGTVEKFKKWLNSRHYYQIEDVIEGLFGKDLLEKMKSHDVEFVMRESSNFEVVKYGE